MLKTKYFSVVLPLLLIVFCSFSVSAKDEWLRVNSKNFHLVGNASEKDIRKVATKLEQFRETLRILLKTANFDSAIPTNVLVFKSDSSYKPFKPKRADGKIDEFVAGYFMPGKDVNYITLSTGGEDAETFGTIFHEYVHFMVEMNFGKSDIPAWFNEGLAEYYQTFAIEKDQAAKLGMFQQGHIDLLSQSKLMPLDTLFNISNYQLHQQGSHSRSIFYAQSWALIHYLFQNSDKARSEGLEKFLNALINNVPPQKAFQDSFQITYAEMEKELKKYVTQNTYKYQVFTFSKKLVFDSEMKVSPLVDAEMNSYLGDLLAHTRRSDDAEPYLKKALELDPNSSMAHNSMGMIKIQQRKFQEAKVHLEKAISGDSKNHLAYYNYAYVLSREGRDEFGYVTTFPKEQAKQMRDALSKSIAINPAYTESYELLAFVNMVNNEQLDESVQLLKNALKYQPGDQQIILRIAEILSRQEKFDDAKYLAEKISNSTSEPDVKSRADNVLSRIQTMQNVKAQNEAMRKRYEEERKQYESQRNQSNTVGNKPVLTRRTSELTPEQIAKINEDAQMLSINQALKQPSTDEKQILGKITKIACVQKTIVYTVKTDSGTLSLFSNGFQNLALVSFDSGAENAQIACNANLAAFNSVVTYKVSTAPKQTYAGELIAIDFVPANFRFMKESDAQTVALIDDRQIPKEAESSQTANVNSQNNSQDQMVVTTETPKTEDFEAKRREMMMQSVRNALRQPQAGETRLIGILEKIECDNKAQYFVFKTATESLKLKVSQGLQLKSFVPDLGGVAFECGMKQFNANAVITFKPNTDKKTKFNGELVSLEFVPNSFKLE
ncbi:MAG: tetratricopeptide repeat protein [Acidobacteriota bacterium]